MKIVKSIVLSVGVALTAFAQSCTAKEYTPAYGNIGYEGAQLFNDAAGKNAASTKLSYGDIVEFDAANNSAFVHVKNIATGIEGYVDTLCINRAQYPLEAPFAFDQEQTEPALLNIESVQGGESSEGWALWNENGKIKALNVLTLIYSSGRIQSTERYYVGEAKPGYVILTGQIDYGQEQGEKLDSPIVIYEDIAGRAGIFVGGKIFTPGGSQGGFDTDDWE